MAGIFLAGALSLLFAQGAAAPLAAPSLIAPPDESTFTNHPRTVHFRWSAVPNAAGYAIEIDCEDCCRKGQWCSEVQGSGYVVADLKQPEYQFDFWGNQKGRWRVWAVDDHAQPGFKSAWAGFRYIGVPNAVKTPAQPPPPAAAPTTSQGEPVYSYGPGITQAKAIYTPQPKYTEAARKAKIQGEVVMDVVIGADGKTRDVKVLRSLEPSLDAKAVEALKTWRFEPATKDGHPVATRAQISTSFRLL